MDNEGSPLERAGSESDGGTHRDSRDQTRQLMFSNRGPSFSVSEHLEKMDHMAIRLQALAGSIWCILAASSDSTGAGAFKRDGILERGLSWTRCLCEREENESWVWWETWLGRVGDEDLGDLIVL